MMLRKELQLRIRLVVRRGVTVCAVGMLVYSLFAIALQYYWIPFLGNISAFSLGSISIIYLLAEGALIQSGLDWVDTLVWPALIANAYLQSYEVIYHFSFPVYLNYFQPPFLNGEGIRYLVECALTIIPIVLIRKHLTVTRLTVMFSGLFVVLWMVWILHGFPQYFHDGYFYSQVLRTTDPFSFSLTMNFGSKLSLATVFLSLFHLDVSPVVAFTQTLMQKLASLRSYFVS